MTSFYIPFVNIPAFLSTSKVLISSRSSLKLKSTSLSIGVPTPLHETDVCSISNRHFLLARIRCSYIIQYQVVVRSHLRAGVLIQLIGNASWVNPGGRLELHKLFDSL